MKLHSLHPRRLLRRAFTLVEVLVVISIFVLLLAIAVPAFSSMLYSSEQSLVENSVRIAMSAARDYASRSPAGQDAAAVFVYDAESKKTSILICTLAGTLQDALPPGAPSLNTAVLRDVFATAPGVESIQLTAGWTIRGYAPGGTIDDEWYEKTYPQAVRDKGNWLFPETSFYDDGIMGSGNNRQSFMVRFEGGTGMVKLSSPNTALVHVPSTNIGLRDSSSSWPTSGNVPNAFDPDNEPDDLRFVKRILAWPVVAPSAATASVTPLPLLKKRDILGDKSPDTILCKAIGQIAVCSERRLARAIGIEIHNATGCVYGDPAQPTQIPTQPVFVDPTIIAKVNDWVEGHYVDTNNEPVDSDCRVFTIHRYLGWLQEVTGTQGGLGVGS